MAKQLLFALSVLAFGSYVIAKLSEEPSVKVNIAVNTDQGSTHESVAYGGWCKWCNRGKRTALRDRNGRARQLSTLDTPILPGLAELGMFQ